VGISGANVTLVDTQELVGLKKRRSVAQESFVIHDMVGKESHLNLTSLRVFLKKYRVFPDKHRPLIWRHLLALPNNQEAYDNLCKMGTHERVSEFERHFPLSTHKLTSRMKRVLSSLAYHCSLLGDVQFVSPLVFPFIKLFG
jgi:Rab-GTPase-TBC domain